MSNFFLFYTAVFMNLFSGDIISKNSFHKLIIICVPHANSENSQTILTFQILFPKCTIQYPKCISAFAFEGWKVFLEFLIFSPLFSIHKYLKTCSKARLKNSFHDWNNLLHKGKLTEEEQSDEIDEKKKVLTQWEKDRDCSQT